MTRPAADAAKRDGPVWRADGRALAFAMDGGLWTMPVGLDGSPAGPARQIAGEAVDFPSWEPDGTSLVFVTPRGLKRLEVGSDLARPIPLDFEYEPSAAGGRLMIRNINVVDSTGGPLLENLPFASIMPAVPDSYCWMRIAAMGTR